MRGGYPVSFHLPERAFDSCFIVGPPLGLVSMDGPNRPSAGFDALNPLGLFPDRDRAGPGRSGRCRG